MVEPTAPYDLADRYRSGAGPVLLTGVQAIARMMVEQHVRDTRAGRRVATFVSGYQGSPLGGVDKMLLDMPGVLTEHDIVFTPGFNEELAATAVWGSQTDLPAGTPTHDGVVGVWYGKGPGVDRATDALRHANMYGVNPRGGVLLLVGDDPASKSSTVPAVSERSLAALGIPVLFPRNAEEIVTMGMQGIALSRASGCVVAMKIVADVADGAWTVDADVADLAIIVPEINWDGKPFSYRQRPMAAPADSLLAEADLYGPRWATVRAFGDVNCLDVLEVAPVRAKIGIAATGTTFDAVRQTLLDLGVDDAALHRAGIRLLRIGMPYPVGRQSVREFACGLEQVIVVEDKTAFIETQIREILYGSADAPQIVGKYDAAGAPLFPVGGELTAGRLLAPLRRVLRDHVELKRTPPPPLSLEVLSAKRTAYFCSGCPHNRSTAIPEGSIGGGGIGCHTLVTMSGRSDSAVVGLTQMGGEGSQWIGQAPFTDVPHLFQNVGDGTFFHSGQLAVQACIAAGVNITYKLLYNEVVAMTGAQDVEGGLGVAKLTHKLTTEGVKQIIVCADEPKRHNRKALAKGTLLWHRDRLDEAQKLLREIPGVTVLIYDQHCAADARRQRKRGTLPTRTTRVVINEAVCEGCGDCGTKSNCLSVQPVDTEFGRKTRIDQTSCNTDYSCLDGDCPSFVTVEMTPDTKGRKASRSSRRSKLAEPPRVADPGFAVPTGTQNVLLAGIGGTGIVTVNQVLATAALRAGYAVESLDQIGLSQKAGPVVSHLRFSTTSLEPSNRLTPGSADCVIAIDLLTATDTRNLSYGSPARTVAVASTSQTPTGDMVYDKSVAYPDVQALLDRLAATTRTLTHFDALAAAQALFGNTAAANFLVVGAAFQNGGLRLPEASIEEAIGINGVAVAANVAAFRWGRVAVADPAAFAAAVSAGRPQSASAVVDRELLAGTTFDGAVRRLVEVRAGELVRYQNAKVARHYVETVHTVWQSERAITERTEFSEAVARGLHKFTAYKDEYEVARLLVDPAFLADVQAQVPGGENLTYRLHPPVLRAMGRTKKVGFGPKSHAALKLLAKGKVLRGTKLDPFGYAHVRKVERELLAHYIGMVRRLAAELSVDNYAQAVEAAGLPDLVRGYEDVKLGNVELYRARLRDLGITA
ncbi:MULTISPECIES: indolepyruvate ferredoxin oxidoreductase family protein [Mycolicibacterium]|uniref:Indolepyruvate ferredoxin oxidoreductase n=1 Tax=Mycolicibacterium senegalense TaxID=1796 RepID=A0A378W6L0_9MYCO|nr:MULTISPECIES: indolepyruvate ferredoxin oxidoreductase family protein [Mycolicibacterium]MCV7334410.1 indolepyruvate ferredoxin oxidoreductase family protein [Mycolicibacterium senegalense]QZA27169.1 indolepyruvate ferredoxin oxidoreductase family protein [Mycolicibacterium senegalense]SUA28022.1 indolepyruvate ferredoxin oxidoreductase [Mycolicibacterium senegalense]